MNNKLIWSLIFALIVVSMPSTTVIKGAEEQQVLGVPVIEKNIVLYGKEKGQVNSVEKPFVKGNKITLDNVYFGKYWQGDTDGDGIAGESDEKELIKWNVVNVEGDEAVLVSDCILDWKPYNETVKYVTWETCSLRKWLNEEFFVNAFSEEEQNAICESKVALEGKNVTDKVYIDSVNEINQDLGKEETGYNKFYCREASAYAQEKGADRYPSWFYRTTGKAGINSLNIADYAGGMEENVKSAPKTIQSSAAAYRDLNATLGNFYEQPKNDNADMDELLERIASLESELETEKGKASAMDDQVALMEKSYELAAKYMGGQNGTQPPVGQAAEPYPVQKAGKNTAAPVRQVTHQVVSSLSQPMSNAEFVASFSQERNRSFNTAVGVTTVSDRNTISACVYGAQSVTDGQAVRLRLLEPMAVADKIIPRNAVVVGTAKIQGERLDIEITSLEYAGTIIPVELAVYDTDGQPGIFIPNSMEMNAVREVAANMGGSLGSSINISTNAGAQLASDLGKGLIQGTSQYIAKKMRTVKVHLKSGYKVMLYQDRD